jgi:hypothetical protein
MSAMTKREWMAYIEKTWDAAQKEAWANQQPTKIFGPNLEEILNGAGFYRKREWVSLTDEEVSDAIDDVLEGGGWLDVARALEAKLRDKNHG